MSTFSEYLALKQRERELLAEAVRHEATARACELHYAPRGAYEASWEQAEKVRKLARECADAARKVERELLQAELDERAGQS